MGSGTEKQRGPLKHLRETEYKPVEQQSALRQENSPLTEAFEDPVLRSAGLTSEKSATSHVLGLSHRQLHEVVCSGHLG